MSHENVLPAKAIGAAREYLDAGASRVFEGSNGRAPAIFVIDSPEHPFDADTLGKNRRSTVVSIPVDQWGDALTPWPAKAIYRGEPDYGGEAAQTLSALLDEVIPALEAAHGLSPSAHAICGYSLGGLFALYALTHSDAFAACACLSGSVWYEGWVEHVRALPPNLAGRFAYLSLGTKERRAARPILKTVQDCMEACTQILQEHGCQVEYRTGPGNHLQHIPERLYAGLTALDEFLCREYPSPLP